MCILFRIIRFNIDYEFILGRLIMKMVRWIKNDKYFLKCECNILIVFVGDGKGYKVIIFFKVVYIFFYVF